MPVNWDKFQSEVDTAVENAGRKTDAELAGKISGVSRLTDNEIRRMFPDPGDAKRLAELMEIVRSAGEHNNKINRIVKNAEHFGSVIFTLLKKLA